MTNGNGDSDYTLYDSPVLSKYIRPGMAILGGLMGFALIYFAAGYILNRTPVDGAIVAALIGLIGACWAYPLWYFGIRGQEKNTATLLQQLAGLKFSVPINQATLPSVTVVPASPTITSVGNGGSDSPKVDNPSKPETPIPFDPAVFQADAQKNYTSNVGVPLETQLSAVENFYAAVDTYNDWQYLEKFNNPKAIKDAIGYVFKAAEIAFKDVFGVTYEQFIDSFNKQDYASACPSCPKDMQTCKPKTPQALADYSGDKYRVLYRDYLDWKGYLDGTKSW